MRLIETTATISEDGLLTAQLPCDIPRGEHRVILMIDEPPMVGGPRPPLNFPVDNYGPWPEGLSLRREDMYDHEER